MAKLRLINIIIVLSVFPLLALLARDYILYKGVPSGGAAARVTVKEARPVRGIMDYAPVVEKGVFPTGAKRLVPIETMEAGGAGAAESGAANVALMGTFVGPRSFAVFMEAGGGVEKVFKVGESVFGAGELKEVLRDRVVVSTGFRDITFVLTDKDAGPELPEMEEQRQPPAPEAASPGMRYSKRLGENEWVIDQGAVLNSLEDFSSVLSDARLTPKMSNGAVEGFVVTEIKPRGVFDAMGLKNGDVLTRINGFDIDSPEKAMQVLSGLRGETDIALDIIRGGQKNSFHYRIR
ncbi:MAG: type II secretion system protein N [Deltaproteobacteria bacterium]|nr:type II secretion system protein N [Deltaproteobacteria bacterium]